jgi:hypothetical protein
VTGLFQRAWSSWCRTPARPATEQAPPNLQSHDLWLATLLEELRTPLVEGEFRRNDALAVFDRAETERDLLRAFIPDRRRPDDDADYDA